jgi:hypothetical protein
MSLPPQTVVEQNPLLLFFQYTHLPEGLRQISEQFAGMAYHMASLLPANMEREQTLRKLLEAKDCAVRAQVLGEMVHAADTACQSEGAGVHSSEDLTPET